MSYQPRSAVRPIQVVVGPLSVFFTNVNTAMNLKGHSHFAQVSLTYRARQLGDLGFPSFGDTHAELQAYLMELLARPLVDFTNEDVAHMLFDRLDGWLPPSADNYGRASFDLEGLVLSVRGVPDAIGHADGFTSYVVGR